MAVLGVRAPHALLGHMQLQGLGSQLAAAPHVLQEMAQHLALARVPSAALGHTLLEGASAPRALLGPTQQSLGPRLPASALHALQEMAQLLARAHVPSAALGHTLLEGACAPHVLLGPTQQSWGPRLPASAPSALLVSTQQPQGSARASHAQQTQIPQQEPASARQMPGFMIWARA